MDNQDFIKVLVVDDSTVMRKFIVSALEKSPNIKVIATAENGEKALELIKTLSVDVVTLDVEMPVMDGLTALTCIRKINHKVPIIMCSTLTEGGARVTIDALSKGANDYVAKPTSLGENNKEKLASDLTEKVVNFGKTIKRQVNKLAKVVTPPKQLFTNKPIGALAIGVSTGGPTALSAVFKQIKKPTSFPIFVTQHMPPIFTKIFAERLNSISCLNVLEATEGLEVKPGYAYLAPGDFHMELAGNKNSRMQITLSTAKPENSCRPAVDVMFRSLANIYGNDLRAIVMTGMGSDGAKGAKSILEGGGEIFIQDEESSAVWGMPSSVVLAGIKHTIINLEQISSYIDSCSR
jgi:two-component system, chemotaxis family, protein-glutamate methylesterase/glutaminase